MTRLSRAKTWKNTLQKEFARHIRLHCVCKIDHVKRKCKSSHTNFSKGFALGQTVARFLSDFTTAIPSHVETAALFWLSAGAHRVRIKVRKCTVAHLNFSNAFTNTGSVSDAFLLNLVVDVLGSLDTSAQHYRSSTYWKALSLSIGLRFKTVEAIKYMARETKQIFNANILGTVTGTRSLFVVVSGNRNG